jgi:hypothetical protein
LVGPAAKREVVAHLKSVLEMSARRACRVIAADRKTIRYRSTRPPETALRARLRELANERRRFGYRRLFILLRREGEPFLGSQMAGRPIVKRSYARPCRPRKRHVGTSGKLAE